MKSHRRKNCSLQHRSASHSTSLQFQSSTFIELGYVELYGKGFILQLLESQNSLHLQYIHSLKNYLYSVRSVKAPSKVAILTN